MLATDSVKESRAVTNIVGLNVILFTPMRSWPGGLKKYARENGKKPQEPYWIREYFSCVRVTLLQFHVQHSLTSTQNKNDTETMPIINMDMHGAR